MKNQEINKHKKPRKLLDQVRDMCLKHYAYRTEHTYTGWIKRFILFHDKKHPGEMGEPEVEAFLTWLPVERKVAKSTQNQAFNALIFLYREVLKCNKGIFSYGCPAMP
ncbi:MAG: phage integrase N-terminal SAM-like domain-containing protein [Syntrophaceae bacterium]|nr:phage integrase N-terminal SAM-like domain-containing protein [Syntrophaceae bacterium]